MCPSPPFTPSSVRGLRLSTSDPRAQDITRVLRALIEAIESKPSSLIDANASFGESCHLPLSHSQSHLLAGLATTFVPRSTWWSMLEASDMWALFGEAGEASGPQVTMFILATSDKDVMGVK